MFLGTDESGQARQPYPVGADDEAIEAWLAQVDNPEDYRYCLGCGTTLILRTTDGARCHACQRQAVGA